MNNNLFLAWVLTHLPQQLAKSPEKQNYIAYHVCYDSYQARALRALGLLLVDGAPTVGRRGRTF